jgi:ubiquinone/menaquinone biosynthesis C-methylase UbiE
VAGLKDADSTEHDPATPIPVIDRVSCPVDASPVTGSRLTGKLDIRVKRGSLASKAYHKTNISEPFSCNFELNPEYRPILEKAGLIVSGISTDGGARIIELPGPHYFYVATGFVPQFLSEPDKPHPLILAYLQAALEYKKIGIKGNMRPETVENRWDILYRDYPDVYNEFANFPISRQWIDVARKMFDIKDKTVADIGAGSGQSTFQLAKYAGKVIGVEPEDAMREIAAKTARRMKLKKAEFCKGWAEDIPLENGSVDITVSTSASQYYPDNIFKFNLEAERITRKGGFIVVPSQPPGWYGGELSRIIVGKSRNLDMEPTGERAYLELGYSYRDYSWSWNFGTAENAIATYGFIFGSKVIAYLRKHNKSVIKSRGRIYYKQV